ncbi:hypothetical protein QQ045_019556 [Rhodiola kirilowii]
MMLRGVPISPILILLQSQPARRRVRSVSVSALTSSSATPALFSISDQSLESKGFVLERTTEDLNLDQLNSIFVAVGFPKRDTEKIRVALAHTDAMLWIEDTRRSRPVAFARATGDGVFNSIIWDVVVFLHCSSVTSSTAADNLTSIFFRFRPALSSMPEVPILAEL